MVRAISRDGNTYLTLNREGWIDFLAERVEQIEKYAPAGGRIVLDLNQAVNLLDVLIGE